MPRLDGTGPQGLGPMTGRGLGPCSRGYQRGMVRGYGRGFGRGWFNCPWYPAGKSQEKEFLKNEAIALEDELKQIKERLVEIEKQKE